MRKIPCEVYSRVVGYFRPVQNWNKGKQQEFFDRLTYSVPSSLISHALRTDDTITIGVSGIEMP